MIAGDDPENGGRSHADPCRDRNELPRHAGRSQGEPTAHPPTGRGGCRGDEAEAARFRSERRRVDARFDREQALAGTVRYLTERRRSSTHDLAVVSYHMGIGNLAGVVRAYTGRDADPSTQPSATPTSTTRASTSTPRRSSIDRPGSGSVVRRRFADVLLASPGGARNHASVPRRPWPTRAARRAA